MAIKKNRLTGFSLIEVLIAIAIVALIAVVSLPLFSIGLKNVKNSEMDSKALFTIESKLEKYEYDEVLGDNSGTMKFILNGELVEIPIEFHSVKDVSEDLSLIVFKRK